MELEAISNLKFYAIMNLALRFVFLIFALFFLSVAFNLSTRFSEVIKLYHKRFDKNSIFYIALDNNKFKTLFSYCLFAVWILGNIALVYGILNFLSLIEIIFLNKNYIFSFIKADTFYFSIRNGLIFIFYPLFSVNIIELFFKMIVLLYVSICFMIIFYLMKYRAKHDKESNLNYPKTIIDPIISELATKLNINCPSIVYINSPNIKAEAKVLGFFRLNKIIKISSATVNKLNNLQLKGILAHEMYHIKYHGMKWNLLKKLSEYSLFGSGFLVNIISPYDIEFKADEFALNYLREYNGSIQVFESALLNIARTNQAFEGTDNDGNGLFMYQSKGNNNQTNSRINQFIELFVSEKISSYIHPTIRHRIENLKRYELNYLR